MTTVNIANKFTDDQRNILINMWQSEPAPNSARLWNIGLTQIMRSFFGCNYFAASSGSNDSWSHGDFIQSILLPLLIRIFVRHVVTLRHIWRKCCDNFTPPWAKFFDWQISHAYFCFVSAFCFTGKHAETKLKQNNFTETKHCFAFVLFKFCFSFISLITTALEKQSSTVFTSDQ